MCNVLLSKQYQPKFLSDFKLINSELTDVFNTFLQIDSLLLLLLGSSGSGKTAYINAIINEYYKNYSATEQLNNIMHISNVDEFGISCYRTNVKSFCQTRSTIFGKKKMVIIDDFDTINEQGQQVFRGYIDKYNDTVHFVMSCSNILKISESIQSRLFIVSLPQLTNYTLEQVFDDIISSEKIDIDVGVKPFIINASNKSVKMLIGYIEMLKLFASVGITLSVIVIISGMCNMIIMFVLWTIWLSLVNVL